MESVETNCFTVGSSNELELMSDNEGITIVDKMKIKIPKVAGKKDYKDVKFLVKYLVR